MCGTHVVSAAVEQNKRSQSLVWFHHHTGGNQSCFQFSDLVVVGLTLRKVKIASTTFEPVFNIPVVLT